MSGRNGGPICHDRAELNILCHPQPAGGAWVQVLWKTIRLWLRPSPWVFDYMPRNQLVTTERNSFRSEPQQKRGLYKLWLKFQWTDLFNFPLDWFLQQICFFMEPTEVPWQWFKRTTGASIILSTALPHVFQDGCHCGSNSFILVCLCPFLLCYPSVSQLLPWRSSHSVLEIIHAPLCQEEATLAKPV